MARRYLTEKNGKTGHWRYRFVVDGKTYSGNTGQSTADEAYKVANEARKQVKKSDCIEAALKQRIDHLAGERQLSLDEAWATFYKNYYRAVDAGAETKENNESMWKKFVVWMKKTHPNVVMMNEVTEEIAGEWWGCATAHRGADPTKEKPAPRTANAFLSINKRVFRELAKVASCPENPFGKIERLPPACVSRDAYTPEEIELINENAEGWIRYLFMVGIHTGMREGDLCLLKWSNIKDDMIKGVVFRKTAKKRPKPVDIPIMDALREYIESLRANRKEGDVYLNPYLAERYMSKGRSRIGIRFGRFLRKLGIETDVQIEGRARASKSKDVHSLRHTFVYIAGLNKIPISLVQDIVGHMTPEMTAHYNAHAREEEKRRYFGSMDFLSAPEEGAVVTREQFDEERKEKQRFMQRAEAATSKLELIAAHLETLTAQNFHQKMRKIARAAGMDTEEIDDIITVPVISAQIA